MYPLGAEGIPLKVQFSAASGTVIGAIFADGLECTVEGIGFYFGTRRVALLDHNRLHFDGRSVDRCILNGHRPFCFESVGMLRIQLRGTGNGNGQDQGPEKRSFDS